MDLKGLENDKIWHLFAEEGDMKLYKRELEENGFIVDPLKACHTVKASEYITFFWICKWDRYQYHKISSMLTYRLSRESAAPIKVG